MVRFFSSLCEMHGKSRGVLLAYRKCFILHIHGGTESDKRKTNLYTGKMQLAVIPTSVKQVDLCSAKKLSKIWMKPSTIRQLPKELQAVILVRRFKWQLPSQVKLN